MATHELAWQRTRQRKGLQSLQPLSDELTWGTAALKHATSWQHIDDEGFGTVVTNMAGCKYWVVGRHRRDSPVSEWHGNMGRAIAFGKTLRPLEVSSDLYEHKGLLLTAGTVL